MQNPPTHKFVVFSAIGDDDVVKSKHAQCTNCGIIHRVTELGRSEIIQGREAMSTIVTIEDIKSSLPAQLAVILESNKADLPTWEAAQFIVENQLWGDFVVLTSEVEDGVKHGKYVRVMSDKMFKVESFSRDEVVK